MTDASSERRQLSASLSALENRRSVGKFVHAISTICSPVL